MSRFSESVPSTNISDVVYGMRNRKTFILGSLLFGLLAGFLFLKANKPAYQAEAQVIIENLITPYDKTNPATDAIAAPNLVDDRMVASQLSVLKSNDLAARVVDQLGLDKDPAYNSKLRAHGTLTPYLIAMGFKDDPALYGDKELAIKTLLGSVTIYQVPESNVIGVKSSSADGPLAANTANALVETFVLSTHEIGASSTDRARTWLGKQIDDLRVKVVASDNAVEKYRNDSGLLKGTTSTLGTQQISEMNSQITVAETAATEAIARANEIKSMLTTRGSVDASSDVLASTLVQNLREQQTSAQRKISELSAVYLPNHPKMIAARQDLAAINNQVRLEALKVVDSLNGQAKVAQARAVSLQASLDKLKGTEADANFSDVKLKALQREADANRTLLETMLSRYADASSRQDTSLQPGFARIIQKAMVPPAPYFPKTGPILLLSALAGLALGLGFAFVLEVLSSASRAEAETLQPQRHHPLRNNVVEDMNIPDFNFEAVPPPIFESPKNVFGVAPKDPSATVLSVMPAALTTNAAFSLIEDLRQGRHAKLDEATARVAATLSGLKTKMGYSSFAFTSIGSVDPNAALATIATARSLAAAGHKVIAIDVTPASGFETLCGLQLGIGLAELVAGSADFTKVVARDPSSPVHFIRFGHKVTSETETLVAQRLATIMKALHSIYAYVLLHGGEANADTMKLINVSDVAVLLATQAKLKDASDAARAIEKQGKTKTLLLKLDLQPASEHTDAAAS